MSSYLQRSHFSLFLFLTTTLIVGCVSEPAPTEQEISVLTEQAKQIHARMAELRRGMSCTKVEQILRISMRDWGFPCEGNWLNATFAINGGALVFREKALCDWYAGGPPRMPPRDAR